MCQTCGLDLVTLINFGLSLLILIVGCRGYLRYKNKTPFHIGVAFGLFSVSHLISLLGIERNFHVTVMLIRVFGYLIVLFALLQIENKKGQ